MKAYTLFVLIKSATGGYMEMPVNRLMIQSQIVAY